MQKLVAVGLSVMIILAFLVTMPEGVFAATDTIGGTTLSANAPANYVVANPITVSASGTLQSVGIDFSGTQSGNVRVGLYSAGAGKPATLLGQSGDTVMNTGLGWQDIPVTGVSLTSGTTYWIAFLFSQSKGFYYVSGGSRSLYTKSYGILDDAWSASSTQDSYTTNMRITYSTGPPPSDFTITASPSSQSIGASTTASTTLTVTAGGGFSGTVSLSVTSGCPAGVTCTVSPTSIITSGTATLSVPTLLSTSGTFSVVVTATSGTLSHTVTFTVTVAAPGSYSFNVKVGATQVVVTVSWSGSTSASVTIQGPGGTPSLSESGAIVYDRTSYVSGSSTPTNIHRVTFTITAPSSAETWTALVSLSSSYTVTIEVS